MTKTLQGPAGNGAPFGVNDPAGSSITPTSTSIAAQPQAPRKRARRYRLELQSDQDGDNVPGLRQLLKQPEGGWLVITHRGHAWLHGSRQAAIEEKHWLDAQWWGQR
jgi:hypothetical protein